MKNNEIIMKKNEVMDHGTRTEQKSSKDKKDYDYGYCHSHGQGLELGLGYNQGRVECGSVKRLKTRNDQ